MSPSCGTGETIRLSRVSVRDLESTQWLDISSSVWVCNALSSDGFVNLRWKGQTYAE